MKELVTKTQWGRIGKHPEEGKKSSQVRKGGQNEL